MLKALTGEWVNEVVQTCQQFHGGMGFIRETAIERLWRDARVLGIGPDAALLAVLIGTSADFLTPIGHKNNTIIMGPGNYRFGAQGVSIRGLGGNRVRVEIDGDVDAMGPAASGRMTGASPGGFLDNPIDEVRWIITNDEATVKALAASGELTMSSQFQSPDTYKALVDMGRFRMESQPTKSSSSPWP